VSSPPTRSQTDRLQEKIGKLREQMRQLDETKAQLKSEPGQQRSLTDPDARSMLQSGKSTGIVATTSRQRSTASTTSSSPTRSPTSAMTELS
jgi:hypothetical protein